VLSKVEQEGQGETQNSISGSSSQQKRAACMYRSSVQCKLVGACNKVREGACNWGVLFSQGHAVLKRTCLRGQQRQVDQERGS
jgi:hypothetical protein